MRGAGGPGAPAGDPADAEVLARARTGDHEAFRVLVERYQARAFRLARRLLRDEEQARDVVQEAFLRVYRSLDRFEGRSSFYTWLYRVVMNLCLDTRRRDRSDRHVEWDEKHALQADPASGSEALSGTRRAARDPDSELERAEIREAVASAIAQLPDDARRTLLLREVDGLSYAEIARALRIPKGTVMSRLHHARRRVRELLVAAGAVDGAAPAGEGGRG